MSPTPTPVADDEPILPLAFEFGQPLPLTDETMPDEMPHAFEFGQPLETTPPVELQTIGDSEDPEVMPLAFDFGNPSDEQSEAEDSIMPLAFSFGEPPEQMDIDEPVMPVEFDFGEPAESFPADELVMPLAFDFGPPPPTPDQSQPPLDNAGPSENPPPPISRSLRRFRMMDLFERATFMEPGHDEPNYPDPDNPGVVWPSQARAHVAREWLRARNAALQASETEFELGRLFVYMHRACQQQQEHDPTDDLEVLWEEFYRDVLRCEKAEDKFLDQRHRL